MRRVSRGLIAFGIWILLSSSSVHAGVAGTVNRGTRFYESGKYDKAIEKYNAALQRQPESDIINFNVGGALYKSGQYKDAADHFQKALLSDDQGLKQKAHYNAGNALFRQGQTLSLKDPQAAVPLLKMSLTQYEQALTIDQADPEAKFNYAVVKKFLEELQKQIQQQKQQQSQQKDQQQQDQQQGQQQDQQQDQQQKDQQQDQQQKEQAAQDQSEGQNDSQNAASSDPQQLESGSSSEEKESRPSAVSAAKAQRFLDEYEQSQEAKQLMNLKGSFSDRPVLKDW